MGNKSDKKINKRAIQPHTTHKSLKNSLMYDKYICTYCNKPIKDLTAALSDTKDGAPIHFDCVLDKLHQTEILKEDETIVYIGQGRFAVIKYVSPVTMKDFNIIRIIDWEDKNNRSSWRKDIADQFNQTS